MATHVKIVGILHIVFGALGMVVAIGLLVFFGGLAGAIGAGSHGEDSAAIPAGILGVIGIIVCIVVMLLSIPGLIAGIGLVKFRPWARILGIVISALDLLSVPFGTALGVYGLWVLLSTETEALFRQYGNSYVARTS